MDDRRIRSMKRMRYEGLRADLLELPGVGNKVADCVSLFGFGRLEAFPIDVWIERAMERLYGVTGSYDRLRHFAAERFGPYAGYAQEYIYHNERIHSRSGDCLFTRQDGSCDRTP
jgi:N-glycosylase/DNA lyase